MTRDTLHWSSAKNIIHMTRFAGNGCVSPARRKLSHIMVEINLPRNGTLPVTLTAFRTESCRPVIDRYRRIIIVFMTGDADLR
jgi:hypothetical protein